MIQDIVDRYMKNKDFLRERFSERQIYEYRNIVEMVIETINPDREYDLPDPSIIHEIDDGSYQGTLVYLIPEVGYQPYDYYLVKVDYGSCSGCDTLEALNSFGDVKPSEETVDGYMTLALHIVQGLKEV